MTIASLNANKEDYEEKVVELRTYENQGHFLYAYQYELGCVSMFNPDNNKSFSFSNWKEFEELVKIAPIKIEKI